MFKLLDELLRKALWLKIAVYAIEDRKAIKPAIEIMKESDCLKIEDLLPHFPDFVVIDDFKEDICSALEEYFSLKRSNFVFFVDHFDSAGTADISTACAAAWMRPLSVLIAFEK